jgi:hypothetical protein
LDFHVPFSGRHFVFIVLKAELIAVSKSLASAGLKLLAEEGNDRTRFHSGWILLIMNGCPSTSSSHVIPVNDWQIKTVQGIN